MSTPENNCCKPLRRRLLVRATDEEFTEYKTRKARNYEPKQSDRQGRHLRNRKLYRVNMEHSLETDVKRASIMSMRREITSLRNRCDELFHALAVALAVPIDPDTGQAWDGREQDLLEWSRSFMDMKMANEVARVAVGKYAAKAPPPCHHDWQYSHHKGGMVCGNCGEFVSDQL